VDLYKQSLEKFGKPIQPIAVHSPGHIAATDQQAKDGFYVDSVDGNAFRDRYGLIHARNMHPSFYDPHLMRPSRMGIEYLLPIFTNAISDADMEHTRQTLFDAGNLYRPYHSVNTDINKRIRYLEAPQ
jgi:6-phosphofructokinase 1